ncbi:MAG: hypothetical protein JW917_09020 [Ignavibacteria bacterium]|nr:hypothetical protein [Ignavibacteria bacterium]
MEINFGRFSDAFQSIAKKEMWVECEKLFDEKDFNGAYRIFFNCLKDHKSENVLWGEDKGKINFLIKQGSKEVRGFIFENKISASANIAEFEKLPVAIMRKLLEMNYNLDYCRFAVDNNKVVIKFDTFAEACPPARLYYALRELAIRADKQDDILINEFNALKPYDYHRIELPQEIKETKYKYLMKWINEVLAKVESVNMDKYSGGLTYILLGVNYRIDYLINPQGELINKLEKIHWNYFMNDSKSIYEKIESIKDEFKEILSKSKESILNEFFDVTSTFGITRPASFSTIQEVFKNNMSNVQHYLDNRMEDVALSIFEYTAGNCLFVYGVAESTKLLFHLIYQVLNGDYFRELGINEVLYDLKEKKFNEELIKEKIELIIENDKDEFPLLKFNTSNLKFDTLISFLKSYYFEMNNLNYNPD